MSQLRSANLLGALAGDIVQRLERHGREHPNETTSAAAALNVIGLYEGCSNNALAQALGLSHTATVRLVDKLEAAGLVVSGSASDRRAVSLRLTEAGTERAKALMRERGTVLADYVDLLSAEQRGQLEAIAETLLRARVEAARDAWHICRLCDIAACPQDECPVHLRAVALTG